MVAKDPGIKNPETFGEHNFRIFCNHLSTKDLHLKWVIDTHGYPPIFSRKANFETLIHIILEQQVSLASAKAAMNKLKEKIGNITPQKIIALTDVELRACYFSRQKIVYARHLAETIIAKKLSLSKINALPDEVIRTELKKIKGIGDWTADVYLMMALQRTDLFPMGDIALVNSIKEVKHLPPCTSKEEILTLAENWRPYRTIAAYILWHAYIKKRNIKI
jgi:DNA-3-methyladenine glycosylase II